MPRKKGVLYGVTEPRLFPKPLRRLTRHTTLGFEAIEFAEVVLGWTLFPWQKWFLKHALELLPDGTPRFKTIVLMIARQNGKTTIIQILTLWKMYVQGARLTLGTAQKEDTAKEVWKSTLEIAQSIDYLAAEIPEKGGISTTNGSIQFRLIGGQRYKVGTANRRGGRGLSVDGFAIIDELREQTSWEAWSAITKTTAAKATGQVVAMSNAGDASSVVLRTLRESALEGLENGTSQSLGWFEYSAPDDCDKWDRAAWAMSNPSLGWNPELQESTLEAFAETDPEDVFRIEVLCQFWTRSSESMFPGETWVSKLDASSFITDDSPLVLSVAAWQKEGTIGRASICAAGLRSDGNRHVEVISSRPGLDWVVDKLVKDYELSGADSVIIQARGAVASRWIPDLRERGVNVVEFGGGDITIAHGSFYQGIIAGDDAPKRVFHIGQENLTLAASEAQIKPLGGQWVFDLDHDVVDVTPLVGCAQALHGLESSLTKVQRRSAYEDSGLVVV